MTKLELLHTFIDELEEDMAKPALHAVADTLPDELVHIALDRMRALRDRLSLFPPNLIDR